MTDIQQHIIRRVLIAFVGFLASLGIAIYYTLTYPAPSLLALLGATLGALRFFRSARHDAPPQDRRVQVRHLVRACILPGIALGAVGNAVLAAAGVAVPDPTVPVTLRLLGGAAFGALAGIVDGSAITVLANAVASVLLVRQVRCRDGAA